MKSNEANLSEATEKFNAARTAYFSAKTSKARRDADEDIQFWGGKMDHFTLMLRKALSSR